MIARNDSNTLATLHRAFDEMRADYNATKPSRFGRRRRGISVQGSNADYHFKNDLDYWRLLEYARDADRNDSVIGHALSTAANHTVQDGITVDPQTGDDELDAELLKRWNDWQGDSSRCDIAREHTLCQFQYYACRAMFADGDYAVLTADNNNGTLQSIESHRIRTPRNTTRNVVLGVLLDTFGGAVEYWITRQDIDPMTPLDKVADIRQYKAQIDGMRRVLHVKDTRRANQTRGVTALAPVFDLAGMIEDVQFAKLVQQQIVSCFAVLRERPLSGAALTPTPTGATTTETLTDGTSRTIEGISPGMDVTGAPGRNPKGFQSEYSEQRVFRSP